MRYKVSYFLLLLLYLSNIQAVHRYEAEDGFWSRVACAITSKDAQAGFIGGMAAAATTSALVALSTDMDAEAAQVRTEHPTWDEGKVSEEVASRLKVETTLALMGGGIMAAFTGGDVAIGLSMAQTMLESNHFKHLKKKVVGSEGSMVEGKDDDDDPTTTREQKARADAAIYEEPVSDWMNERHGRRRIWDANGSARSRAPTPPPIRDTFIRETLDDVKSGINKAHAAKENWLASGGRFMDLSASNRRHVALGLGLEAVGAVASYTDWLSVGTLSTFGHYTSQVAEWLGTGVRREIRSLTGNPRWAQNAGDVVHGFAELYIPAKTISMGVWALEVGANCMKLPEFLSFDTRLSNSAVSLERMAGESVVKGWGAQEVRPLLPGEGRVDTFKALKALEKPGDNLTPNHMPQAAFMEQHGVGRGSSVAMMMEQPTPGVGGRHRATYTYGRAPDFSLTPRQVLARDINDVRRIYQADGVYTPEIRQGLLEVIKRNRIRFPELFKWSAE